MWTSVSGQSCTVRHCAKLHRYIMNSFGAMTTCWTQDVQKKIKMPDLGVFRLFGWTGPPKILGSYIYRKHITHVQFYVSLLSGFGILRMTLPYLLGEEAEASPSIANTLWRVWTMFMLSAITTPKVNGFGWNLGNSEAVVWSCLWQILGAIRAEAAAGGRAEIFLSTKQRSISPTSGRPNFTKFAQKDVLPCPLWGFWKTFVKICP